MNDSLIACKCKCSKVGLKTFNGEQNFIEENL